jgi:DNA primase
VRQVFEEYESRMQAGEDVSQKYFLHHPEEPVKRQLIDICSDAYQLSPNWQSKYSIFIPEETDLLADSVYKIILHLKRNILLARIREMEWKMAEEDADELMLLRELSLLKKKEIEFSHRLGAVVNS